MSFLTQVPSIYFEFEDFLFQSLKSNTIGQLLVFKDVV